MISAHAALPSGAGVAYISIDGMDVYEQCISIPASGSARRATVACVVFFTSGATLRVRILSDTAVTATDCEISAIRVG